MSAPECPSISLFAPDPSPEKGKDSRETGGGEENAGRRFLPCPEHWSLRESLNLASAALRASPRPWLGAGLLVALTLVGGLARSSHTDVGAGFTLVAVLVLHQLIVVRSVQLTVEEDRPVGFGETLRDVLLRLPHLMALAVVLLAASAGLELLSLAIERSHRIWGSGFAFLVVGYLQLRLSVFAVPEVLRRPQGPLSALASAWRQGSPSVPVLTAVGAAVIGSMVLAALSFWSLLMVGSAMPRARAIEPVGAALATVLVFGCFSLGTAAITLIHLRQAAVRERGMRVRATPLLALALVLAAQVFGMATSAEACGGHHRRPSGRAMLRACFANQKTLLGAREMSLLDHNLPGIDFDERLQEKLVADGYLQAKVVCPVASQAPGTRYVWLDTQGDLACTLHGRIRGDGVPVRQQLMEAGITDPAILAVAFTGTPDSVAEVYKPWYLKDSVKSVLQRTLFAFVGMPALWLVAAMGVL